MSHVVSPASDNSNTSSSYIMIDQEQSGNDGSSTTSPTAQIQCAHCSALNLASARTCVKCNTTLTSSSYAAGATAQEDIPSSSLIPNGPTPTSDSSEEESPSLDRIETVNQYDPSEAHHLSAPTGDTYPQQEQLFGNFYIRNLYTSSSLLLFCILSFHLWFSKEVSSAFQSAFHLAAAGSFFIFLGAICCIVWIVIEMKNIRFPYVSWLQYIPMAAYFLGGFLYLIGGCVLAAAYNKSDFESHTSAYSGIWFCEMSFIAAHAILSGLDIKKRVLNTHGLRLVITCMMFLYLSAVMFFCCAIWSTALDARIAGYGLQATGYFGAMVLVPLFILIKLCVTLAHKTQLMVDLLIAVGICVCLLFVVFGYLALTGIDREYMGGYWVGFGLFVMLHGIIIVMDVRLEKILPCHCDKRLNMNSSLTESMLKVDTY